MIFQRALLLLLLILSTTTAQDFYIVAPNTLRLNSNVTIAVAVDGPNGADMSVFIQDYPGKVKNISQTSLSVQPGQPKIFKVYLNPSDFPPNFLNVPGSPKLVSLNVHSENFRKEITIPISIQSGYVFIQTDKLIYFPKQRAHIRIISLNEDLSPSDEVFKLQIRNPDDNIIKEMTFNPKKGRTRRAFVTHMYKFPTYPILGEWSASVLYGYEFRQNSSISFQLQEYVLPIFTVELKTQDLILPSTEMIKISVLSRYVYGKKVKGFVTFRLGVKGEKPDDTFFAVIGPKKLEDGAFELRLNTDELKNDKDIGWFPDIGGLRLVVEAAVVDDATGSKEIAVNTKGLFTTSPFIVSFKRCLQDFKPGHVSVIEANIYYIDGTPAVGISTNIEALADNRQINVVKSTAVSDENGKVDFEIQPALHSRTVTVTIETNDSRYAGSQAKGAFLQQMFQSPNQAYIALSRSTGHILQPGDIFKKMIFIESPDGIRDIYYSVVARGKILAMKKLPDGPFKIQSVEFEITHEMVPSFRVLVFAHFQNELVADSLKFDVESVCNPKAQVSITPEYNVKEPGVSGKFTIRGTKETFVGLLAVDEAVYALSKKDLLTKSKVFDTFETHDLGIGPGGGRNINAVLENVGISIGTNKYTPLLAHKYVENKRRKREAALDEESKYALSNSVSGKGIGFAGLAGDSSVEPDFIAPEDEKAVEDDLMFRFDFRETWIFDDILIGMDNTHEYFASLPHRITTWVVQAVSVSPTHGVCVAEPQKLVSFKKIFLDLNFPYSVVRNKQVEVQATVYNYGDKRISAVMYMYGAENICTGVQPGEKSERKKLIVEPQSAASTSFFVVPIKAGDFPIKVVALTPEGSDVIEKPLHVVHESIPKEINIPIKLDPTNQQKRSRMLVNTEFYSDAIDPAQNLQFTTVKLSMPEGTVPGTASCSITASGYQFGSVIETFVNNTVDLLQKPRGNGENNIMFLGPTLYTVRYLKVTGKLTAAMEEKGYNFIRSGYDNQMKYRKQDDSYSAFRNKEGSVWLTAFVVKVLCQTNELVNIDDNVLCTGIRWLINNQNNDGSYSEKNPIYHLDMMGGVQGSISMTAFILIALEECKYVCDKENLFLTEKKAVTYLEDNLEDVNTPLQMAIVAYALALSDSERKQAANEKLLSMMKTDIATNTMYWTTENATQDIQTAGYGLLTQLLFNDRKRSNAIVNWLNTKELQSRIYKCTQDTVIALQALSEYALRAQMPSMNLVANISSWSDRNFHHVLKFHKVNAFQLQDVKVEKIDGVLFITTTGHGMASLTVKIRYNLIVPPEEICKFNVTVNVSEVEIEKKEQTIRRNDSIKPLLNQKGEDIFVKYPDDHLSDLVKAVDEEASVLDPKQRRKRDSLISIPIRSRDVGKLRIKRENSPQKDSKIKLKISLCVRYLGNTDAGMSIVDVGIFSGCEPVLEDLKALQDDANNLIQRYEISGRGVVFYLQKVQMEQNYCFSFHVVREHIVGNTQTSVIKVYDYYNPDVTCTKFYSASSHNPILRTICENGVCECAEGGCPPDNPFSTVSGMTDTKERRQKLKELACEKYDYVWIGRLNEEVKKECGFLNISFMIDEVIREGIEKRCHVEGEVRTLLTSDNCFKTSPVFMGSKYLILGKDGQKYNNSNGETWYRYMLDKESVVHEWTEIPESKNKELQQDFNFVADKLLTKVCEL